MRAKKSWQAGRERGGRAAILGRMGCDGAADGYGEVG